MDLFEFETYYDESFKNNLDLLDFEEEDQEILKEIPQLTKILSNRDYNLNSPLSVDLSYSLYRQLAGGGGAERNVPVPGNYISWVQKLSLSGIELVDPRLSHQILGHILRDECRFLDDIVKLHRTIHLDSAETSCVVAEFIKGWLGRTNLSFLPRNLPIQCLRWGQLMLECIDLVNLANAPDEAARRKVCKKRYSTGPNRDLRYMRCPNLGKVYVEGELVYLRKYRLLVEKNWVLMLKDILVARHNSLISIHLRNDDKYQNGSNFLLNFYSVGDMILEETGNEAYDIFSTIEPLCNLRFTELAHRHRPLILYNPSFRQHLGRKVTELERINPRVNDLRDLILAREDITELCTYYGSFRHFGHPIIEYMEGLKELKERVQMKRNVESAYANSLASDLSRKVLYSHWKKTREWAVHEDQIPGTHLLSKFIKNNSWPTRLVQLEFGDKWHELPLKKCFDIPEYLDPSDIYSDKSHSLTRSELLQHIANNPGKPIPSKKVLETLLNTEPTHWKNLLNSIERDGIPIEHLIIGLRDKERELKRKGRYFALMSWLMREYFVFTEYLIKEYYLPLFRGLTMADDMKTLIKKILVTSRGQGEETYEEITISNNIDYSKWCNTQSSEATNPIFGVMDRFLGYTKVISRTHEIFENSLVYYRGRPDLLRIEGGQVACLEGTDLVWEGQRGGLEGLRQKGWSILSLLVIERESKIRNTLVKTLAQGDNQVVCTQYKMNKYFTEAELINNLADISRNNRVIMTKIYEGVQKLGMIVNEDESVESADYLNYSKIPIYRGVFQCLETKKWSRVSCMTNDQLPGTSSILSSTVSNALAVAHFSDSPINSMVLYNWFGNFVRNLLCSYNPSLRCSPRDVVKDPEELESKRYKIKYLYLDPSLGGVGGMSLTRFLIRAFPDPVTEALSFWRLVHETTVDLELKRIALEAGNPRIRGASISDYTKLIEDPVALNIPHGMSIQNLVKEEVKKNMIADNSKFKNKVVKDCISHYATFADSFRLYLVSIRPMFPRFISEFYNASFPGIVEGIFSLFQNSRTIRKLYSYRYNKELDALVIKCELISISSILRKNILTPTRIWKCSTKQASELRDKSWRTKIIGSTIPHPLELICLSQKNIYAECLSCKAEDLAKNNYIQVILPEGLPQDYTTKGPLEPYLGSSTSETTSILRPWDQKTTISFIKRAYKLRDAINWLTPMHSNVSSTIINMIKSLTGDSGGNLIRGYKPSGCIEHRFHSARQSSGGYAAQSPSKLMWMTATTDFFREIGDVDYTFMFQALLIYAQMTSGEVHERVKNFAVDHYHIQCPDCLVPVSSLELNSASVFHFPDVTRVLDHWKPSDAPYFEKVERMEIEEGDITKLDQGRISYHIGKYMGYVYSFLLNKGSSAAQERSLFPLTIQYKVAPIHFSRGVADGIILGAIQESIHRHMVLKENGWIQVIKGLTHHIIRQLCQESSFQLLIRGEVFQNVFVSVPHRTPPSFPLTGAHLSAISVNYFCITADGFLEDDGHKAWRDCWLFEDVLDGEILALYLLSHDLRKIFHSHKKVDHKIEKRLKELSHLSMRIRSEKLLLSDLGDLHTKGKLCKKELRLILKDHPESANPSLGIKGYWNIKEAKNSLQIAKIEMTTEKQNPLVHPKIVRTQNPLMSIVRVDQYATSAPTKYDGLITKDNQPIKGDFGCFGDGSGGGTSFCARNSSKSSRGIFNSLVDLSTTVLHGTSPAPPASILMLGSEGLNKILNSRDCWKHPSDLSKTDTWKYFKRLIDEHQLNLSLMFFDMEMRSDQMSDNVEFLIAQNVKSMLRVGGTLIYKSYLERILTKEPNIVHRLAPRFRLTEVISTIWTSSQSSEVYIRFTGFEQARGGEHPDFARVVKSWKNWKCNRTLGEELGRARSVFFSDRHPVLPRELIPDRLQTLRSTLSSLGIDDGVLSVILTPLAKHSNHQLGLTTLMGVMCLCLENLIPTRSFSSTLSTPPSDQTIRRLLVVLLGFYYPIVLISNDLALYERIQCLLTEGIKIYICRTRITLKTKKTPEGKVKYGVSWHLQRKPHLLKERLCFLNSELAPIGQIGKMIMGIFRGQKINCKFLKEDFEFLLKTFSKGLTLKHIHRTTSILSVMTDSAASATDQVDSLMVSVEASSAKFEPWDS
uniref:Replicase n=1 Tax=Murine feces-associated rhabdovirus TaxID=2171387 RepID=A0A2S0SZ18_9RHAB|nr:L polymerase protein [Murine feces-associated rhabdovirus]